MHSCCRASPAEPASPTGAGGNWGSSSPPSQEGALITPSLAGLSETPIPEGPVAAHTPPGSAAGGSGSGLGGHSQPRSRGPQGPAAATS